MRKLYLFLLFLFPTVLCFAQLNDAVVNQYLTEYQIEDGKLIKNVKLEIQINNRDGEDLTHFRIPYSEDIKVTKLNAWIENLSGKKIRSLSNKEIETYSAVSNSSFYEDDFIKYFSIRHNEYPYIVNCEYSTTAKEFLFIADWNPIYDDEYPTENATLILKIPTDYSVKTKQKNIEYTKELTPFKETYQWNASYTTQIFNESFSPPITELVPNVKVIPLNFRYGIRGSQNTWEEFGFWQSELLKGLQILPESEKATIDKLIKGKTTQEEVIEVLYKYLQQNTRYINVSLGVGGLKPYPATYVIQNKYGDCKALTNYMKSMLDYAGVKSYYTKIFANNKIREIDTSLACQQFNHVLLMAPFGNDTTWIECTSKNEPLGYISTAIQNRNAFVIDGQKSKLVKTPKLSAEDVENKSIYSINVKIDGPTKISCKSILKGRLYTGVNNFLKIGDQKDLDNFFRDFLPMDQYSLTNWEILEAQSQNPQIVAKIEASSQNVLKKFGNDYLIKIFKARMPNFETPKERSNPVWIHYPISATDSIEYLLPGYIKIANVSEAVNIKCKYGEYSIEIINQSYKAIVRRAYTLYPGKYSKEEYDEFYDFINQIKSQENNNAILLN